MGANTPSEATRWLRRDVVRGVEFTVRLQQWVVPQLHEHDQLDDEGRGNNRRQPPRPEDRDYPTGVDHVIQSAARHRPSLIGKLTPADTLVDQSAI